MLPGQQLATLSRPLCPQPAGQGAKGQPGHGGRSAALGVRCSVFVQTEAQAVVQQWDQVTRMLSEQFPTAAALMEQAREDVLAFRAFPPEHWRKIWSTNPLERLNKEIKRRTHVVGIFPNDAAIIRLVGALLLEQQEEWQLDGRRVFSELSMTKLDNTSNQTQNQRQLPLLQLPDQNAAIRS